jgi:hypothetical protein
MKLRSILELKRPTHTPETWLPEVRSWLPPNCTPLCDSEGRILALTYTVDGGWVPILFACHLDTVHRDAGHQNIRATGGTIYCGDGNCLGADDGAGIWLMLKMIEARVPGTYLFHLDEECGCRGSRGIVEHHGDWLSQFKRAISFDRPGTTDVITHFAGVRGCRDRFAEDLSVKLSSRLSGYALTRCNSGGLTDVRHYVGLIPECTNLSAGYHRQHSPDEWLDTRYLTQLKKAVIAVFGSYGGPKR